MLMQTWAYFSVVVIGLGNFCVKILFLSYSVLNPGFLLAVRLDLALLKCIQK